TFPRCRATGDSPRSRRMPTATLRARRRHRAVPRHADRSSRRSPPSVATAGRAWVDRGRFLLEGRFVDAQELHPERTPGGPIVAALDLVHPPGRESLRHLPLPGREAVVRREIAMDGRIVTVAVFREPPPRLALEITLGQDHGLPLLDAAGVLHLAQHGARRGIGRDQQDALDVARVPRGVRECGEATERNAHEPDARSSARACGVDHRVANTIDDGAVGKPACPHLRHHELRVDPLIANGSWKALAHEILGGAIRPRKQRKQRCARRGNRLYDRTHGQILTTSRRTPAYRRRLARPSIRSRSTLEWRIARECRSLRPW